MAAGVAGARRPGTWGRAWGLVSRVQLRPRLRHALHPAARPGPRTPGPLGGYGGQTPDKATTVAEAVSPADSVAGQKVTVAKKPPVSGISIGDPHVMALDGIVYATATTTFSIKAVGGVSGVAKSEYRLDSG